MPICSFGLEHTLETWLEVRRDTNSESIDIFSLFIKLVMIIFIRVGLDAIYSLVLFPHSPLYRVITQNLEYFYTFNHGGIIHLVGSVDSLSNVTESCRAWQSAVEGGRIQLGLGLGLGRGVGKTF